MEWTKLGARALMHTATFCIFITIFFRYAVTAVEETVVKKNIYLAVRDIAGPAATFMDDDDRATIRQSIEAARKSIDMGKDDAAAAAQNEVGMRPAWIGVGVAAAVLLGTVPWLWCIDGGVHARDAGLLLLAVAAAEGLFLGIMGLHYRSLDVNFVRHRLVQVAQGMSHPDVTVVAAAPTHQ